MKWHTWFPRELVLIWRDEEMKRWSKTLGLWHDTLKLIPVEHRLLMRNYERCNRISLWPQTIRKRLIEIQIAVCRHFTLACPSETKTESEMDTIWKSDWLLPLLPFTLTLNGTDRKLSAVKIDHKVVSSNPSPSNPFSKTLSTQVLRVHSALANPAAGISTGVTIPVFLYIETSYIYCITFSHCSLSLSISPCNTAAMRNKAS